MAGKEEDVKRLLSNGSILKENLVLMGEWNSEKKANGVPASTRYVLLHTMKMLGEFLNKPFKQATKQDLTEFFNKKNYASVTPMKCARGFFQWLGMKELVEWVRPKEVGTKVDDSKIFSPKEVLLAVNAANSNSNHSALRDAAMIYFAFETGARNSEIRHVRIADVEIVSDNKARVQIRGTKNKWSKRKIPVHQCVPLLKRWLEGHPQRRKKAFAEAYLFPSILFPNEPMTEPTFGRRIKLAFQAAGLEKRAYPHVLRHSAATFDASRLKEAELRKKYGWSPSSRTPAIYVHMNDRMLEDSLDELNGIKERSEEEEFKPKKCHACAAAATPADKFCLQCGAPLTQEGFLKQLKEHESLQKQLEQFKKALEFVAKIQSSKDPEIKKFREALL